MMNNEIDDLLDGMPNNIMEDLVRAMVSDVPGAAKYAAEFLKQEREDSAGRVRV
jgi:hypothetical protein